MNNSTHILAGLTAAVALNATAPETALIALGALLPDIDHSSSTIGQNVKPVAWLLPHRGITHSLLFASLALLIHPSLAIGVGTHIILDLFNPAGVEFFWPFRKRLSVPLLSIKIDGLMEMLLRLRFVFLLCWLLYPMVKNSFMFQRLF